jgi:hypothetical protein
MPASQNQIHKKKHNKDIKKKYNKVPFCLDFMPARTKGQNGDERPEIHLLEQVSEDEG